MEPVLKTKKDMLIQYNFEMLVKYLEGITPLMKLGDNIPFFSVPIDSSKGIKKFGPGNFT